MRLHYSTTIEVDVDITFNWTPAVCAKGLFGPPERAQPPEPAVVEIEEINLAMPHRSNQKPEQVDIQRFICSFDETDLQEQLLEIAPDLAEQYAPGEES